jgi:hypothetical protein
MRTGLVAFAVLFMAFFVSSASHAQNAIVGNKYESYAETINCGSSVTECVAFFGANPAASVVNIERVSCLATTSGSSFVVALQITAAQSASSPVLKSTFIDVANVVPLSNSSELKALTINTETSLLLGVNRFPRVILEGLSQIGSVRCRLSGTVVPPASQ